MKWHEGRMVGFDTETTGINVHDDRIVTAAIVHVQPGQRPRTMQWLIDPGVDVPAEAAQVHGWTNDRIAERLGGAQAMHIINGVETKTTKDAALFEIAAQVATPMHHEIPLVAANASYDLSLLEAELAREGIDSLSSRPSGVRGVVDPQVIEKQFDPYRKVNYPDGNGCRRGKFPCGGCGATDKTLTSLCAHYGVRMTGAHDASADALGALRLVVKLAAVWPEIARWKLATLHDNQVKWRRAQADGLRQYFDKNGIEHDGVCPEWPLHVACAPARVGGAA